MAGHYKPLKELHPEKTSNIVLLYAFIQMDRVVGRSFWNLHFYGMYGTEVLTDKATSDKGVEPEDIRGLASL
jgi:hypothetical protein